METSPSDPNIQKLLNAEKLAQEIVARARTARTLKLKQAKEEAEEEVAVYRREREEEFAKKMAEGSNTSDETFSSLKAESDKTVQEIMESLPQKKKPIVGMLLDFALKVDA